MIAHARILVVEDEAATRGMIAEYLRKEGFEVVEAADGAACFAAFDRSQIDLALLDINLPDTDGLSIARRLRAKSDTGIIFVTMRGDSLDRVVGLELGGDDYVTKPIDLRELLARVRSVLRRRQPTAPVATGSFMALKFSGWTIDLTRRELVSPQGDLMRLTRGEFDLLAALVEGRGRAVSRDYLLDVVSNRGTDVSDRTVDTLVSRLRHKIEENPRQPKMLLTVHGIGYKLSPTVEAA